MNGTDRLITAETRPALLARLQATMPPANGQSSPVSKDTDSPAALDKPGSSRLHQTTFNGSAGPATQPAEFPSASENLPGSSLERNVRSAPVRDYYHPPQNTESKPKRGVPRLAMEGLAAHRWLIAGILLAGGVLGYAYTTQLCVPLYRVQASIELQNAGVDASSETLVHILQSQSLIMSAIASIPEAESNLLAETPRLPLFKTRDTTDQLRERLKATTSPLGQVIDIDLVAPNRQAGVSFLNALIHGLMQRNEERKLIASTLPGEEASAAAGRSGSIISVIDPAMAGTVPVGPSMVVNILVGCGCGMLVGILFALVRKFAATTFAGPGSLREVLGVRELGAIPERKLLTAGGSDEDNAAMQVDANDESLRYLRSSLLYHPGRQEMRCIAFTSAAPGEGKTTVVTNLSMSLAATGRRVLVIDGDLRRPRLYRVLQVPQGPGLSDLLRRDPAGPPAILSKYVAATSFQNLYILPPGSAGNDVPELLAGPLLAKLIRDLGKSFDFVLIDTPPLLACADARNYARSVEGVVLVVRSSETQKSAAIVARDMLLQDGATIIGTVLTGWRHVYPAYNYPSTANYART